MNKSEAQDIIDQAIKLHEQWLATKQTGQRFVFSELAIPHEVSMMLDFRGTNLRCASFRNAFLPGSMFDGAYLQFADFHQAILNSCDFESANCQSADFAEAQLINAYFSEANLSECNFTGANLWGAHLSYAILKNAEMAGCDIRAAKGLIRIYIPDISERGDDVFFISHGETIFVKAGCFWNTLDIFEKTCKDKQKHGYLMVINFVRSIDGNF